MNRRKTRQSSNVFHMLTKAQIVQLREAFNLLDVDADSCLSVDDLRNFLMSIGSPFTDDEIKEMVEELEPNANFMILLTCIGERLAEISSEKELFEQMKLFDDDGTGMVNIDMLRHWMTEKGDPISNADFEYLIRGCVENNKVDCKKLASKIKHGEIINE